MSERRNGTVAGVHDGDGTAVISMKCHWKESKELKYVYIKLDCTLATAHVIFASGGLSLWRGRAIQPVARSPIVTSQPSGLFRALRNRRRRWGDETTRPLREASRRVKHSICSTLLVATAGTPMRGDPMVGSVGSTRSLLSLPWMTS